MKRSITIITRILLFFFISATCFAGAQKEPTGSSAGDELYTIDVYGQGTEERFSADTAIGQFILEKFNINIHYIPFAGDYNNKCALWLAAGDYPETIQLNTPDLAANYLAAGAIMPWDDYLDKMPNYVEFVGEYMGLARATSPDGKVYATHYAIGMLNPGAVLQISVRSDLLEEQGWPNLAVTDEWLDFFRTAKEKHPKTPEGLDTIGLTMPLGEPWSPNAMLLNDQYKCAAPDNVAIDLNPDNETFGDVYDLYEVTHHKEHFQFLNRMWQEGLLDQEIFTDKYDQIAAKAQAKQALGIYYIGWAAGPANQVFRESSPEYEYVALPVMTPSQVEQPGMTGVYGFATSGWGTRFVTTNVKYPDRLFEFWDWAASEEGYIMNGWGIEGETYIINSAGEREPTDKYLELVEQQETEVLQQYGIGIVNGMCFIPGAHSKYGIPTITNSKKYQDTMAYSPRYKEFLANTGDGYETPQGLNGYESSSRFVGVAYANLLPRGLAALGGENPMFDVSQRITEYTNSRFPNLIMAKSDAEFEAAWTETVQKRKDMGIDDVVAAMQSQVDKSFEIMGY